MATQEYPTRVAQGIEPQSQSEVQKPTNPNKGKRLEKWQTEETELKTMLGITELPDQSLDNSEFKRFGDRIVRGDESAKYELTMRSLRLMYGTAKTFANRVDSNELTIEDHFQHAYEGFRAALETFDPEKHESLRSHIQLEIFSKLVDEANKRGLILKVDDIRLLHKLRRAKASLDGDEIKKAEEIERNAAYENLAGDEQVSGADRLEASTEEIVQDKMQAGGLREALGRLSYREHRVLALLYGIEGEQEHTPDEVAKIFEVTRKRIDAVHKYCLKKLKLLL